MTESKLADLPVVASDAPDSEDPEDDRASRVRREFDSLTTVEQDIVRHTVGFEVKVALTLAETANLLGLTETQVRFIQEEAFYKMKQKIQ